MPRLSLREIEETLRTADPQKRHQTLRAVTDLFLSDAPSLDEPKVGVFDNVFRFLVDESERSEVVDLSHRIAAVRNAPPQLIKRLADTQDIAIAGPVLSHSPRLSTEELCEIAKRQSNAHLLAMSKRSELPAPLTDVLIDRGTDDVTHSVVRNRAAQFSDAGLEMLLEKEQASPELHRIISDRADIDAERLNAAMARASKRITEKENRIAAAQRLVITLKQARPFSEAQLVAFADGGQYEELVAALSAEGQLGFRAIDNMLRPQRVSAVVILCKALALSRATLTSVLKMAGRRNNVSLDEIELAHREFMVLSKETSERIVRFWRVRQSVSPR